MNSPDGTNPSEQPQLDASQVSPRQRPDAEDSATPDNASQATWQKPDVRLQVEDPGAHLPVSRLQDFGAETSAVGGIEFSTVPRPKTIDYAFWAYLAAFAINLIFVTVMALSKDPQINKIWESVNIPYLKPGDTGATRNIDIVLGFSGVIAWQLLILLVFVFKMWNGRPWARIVLTVLTAIGLRDLLLYYATTLVWWVLVYVVVAYVVGIMALVFMWRKDSSVFLDRVKYARRYV